MNIREPRLAGLWYPADPKVLAEQVDGWVGADGPEEPRFDAGTRLGGLISPHAGYVYSGPIAGLAYRALGRWRPRRAVVIAPSHRDWFDAASVWAPDDDGPGGWRTPLGTVPVDMAFSRRLRGASKRVVGSVRGHDQEHSLEIQLPFLQRTLGDFELVPVVLGDGSPELVLELGRALAACLDDTPTLLVASTDLSHFQPLPTAKRRDETTLDLFADGNAEQLLEALGRGDAQACGGAPVAALFDAMRRASGQDPWITRLAWGSSADATGEGNQVVGYAALMARCIE